MKVLSVFFFFNDSATTEIYPLSPTRRSSDLALARLGDGGPSGLEDKRLSRLDLVAGLFSAAPALLSYLDRKSTRLNSSHGYISYAVFCLKKKKRSQQVN